MMQIHAQLHERLVAGREALGELTLSQPEPDLLDLLRRMDDALLTLEADTWGVCTVCHDAISSLEMNEHPLVSICLECMTPSQRDALQRDLESAAAVQRALLPPNSLEVDGWEVDYIWEPHGIVSGDHVDLLRPRNEGEPLHLLLGDVAGKGLAASLLQSQLHALFRALAPLEMSLTELLHRTNQLFFEATSASSYATLTVSRLHSDGRVVLANAGHPRPLLADHRGVRPIEDASMPLGVASEVAYVEREIQLHPGDTLFFYTDGLSEAWRSEVEFGVGRAAAALRRARSLPPRQLLASCQKDLARFLKGRPRDDDLTMVAVRRS